MSSATHNAVGEAAETSTKNGKRERPDEVKERMHSLTDAELLECPICYESLRSPPIYQCGNGHVACSACCAKLPQGMKCPTCSQPTGKMRCNILEKILASVQVSCKYARHGCDYKSGKISSISFHERNCRYTPLPCPFTKCLFKGSWSTTTEHLTKVHEVDTVEHNNISGAGFSMKASDRIVMVKVTGMRDCSDVQMICVHHEPSHKKFHGDVFFCTSKPNYGYICVDLKVAYQDAAYSYHSARLNTMNGGSAGDYLKRDFLLLPLGAVSAVDSGDTRDERLIEVHLKASHVINYDSD